MFEIKYRDVMGRIGILDVNGKKVETPLILPVINPKINQITPDEIKKMGFQGIITNSYIIFKDRELKEKAEKIGLPKLLDFDGLIMTDSGSFQLFRYGKITIDPQEIVKFQETIKSDIGVILDIPTPPDVSHDKALEDLEETLKRAKASIKIPRKNFLAGTIQGSTHMDLREKSATEMGKLGFDLYPIGGVVPLMENYRFSELVNVIMHSKKNLPLNKPVHLFGAGHPMIFAFAVAMGCDIFDSAAYALYAKDGRYITAEGTLHLKNMSDLPCPCNVCTAYSPKKLLDLPPEERTKLLAMHNLHATLAEIKRIKVSIREESLFELVQRRARSHPALLDALRLFTSEYAEQTMAFNPVTKKSAFFYSGPESLDRPEVKRHLKRIEEITTKAENLVLLPDSEKPYANFYGSSSNRTYHVCIASPVFGIIPLEVEEIYPLNQHERPRILDADQISLMQKTTRAYAKGFKKTFLHEELKFLKIKGETFADLEFIGECDDRLKIMAMGDYQFGRGSGEALFGDARVEFARTGRIRRVYSSEDVLLATVRASDGFLILTIAGAKRLQNMKYPHKRVMIEDSEVCEIVKEGRNVFAKFVEECDPDIRPSDEILVVDKDDKLLASGKAMLNGEEILAFKKGIAIKVRRGVKG